MKVENATISIFINKELTEIEIHDQDASVTICRVTLTPDQLSACLSRMGYVKCESLEVCGLEKIGKKHQNLSFSFEIPEGTKQRDNNEQLNEMAIAALASENMSEWTPDKYYGGQQSFFKQDGKQFAQCTIRRWI